MTSLEKWKDWIAPKVAIEVNGHPLWLKVGTQMRGHDMAALAFPFDDEAAHHAATVTLHTYDDWPDRRFPASQLFVFNHPDRFSVALPGRDAGAAITFPPAGVGVAVGANPGTG